jgi:hypothetical protein
MAIDLSGETLAYILGGLLLIGGGAALVPSTFRLFGEWLAEDGDTITAVVGSHNSDRSCPAGFVDHVAVVCNASRTADPAVQLSYVAQGLSEADTMRAEITRLSQGAAV